MKQNNYVEILGLRIDLVDDASSIDIISQQIKGPSNQSLVIIKPYVKFLTEANSDPHLLQLLNKSDLSLADGISLQWAASFLYGQPDNKPTLLKLWRSLIFWIRRPSWLNQIIATRGAGVDASAKLLRTSVTAKWRVGIVSGESTASVDIKQRLENKFPGLRLSVWPGYFEASSRAEKEIIDQIKSSKLDILFVARGFPLQEEFIFAHKDENLAKILIGEGGTFDYDQLGGRVVRAPASWRKFGLEWLWRAFAQPTKIGNIKMVLKFIRLVYQQAKKQK